MINQKFIGIFLLFIIFIYYAHKVEGGSDEESEVEGTSGYVGEGSGIQESENKEGSKVKGSRKTRSRAKRRKKGIQLRTLEREVIEQYEPEPNEVPLQGSDHPMPPSTFVHHPIINTFHPPVTQIPGNVYGPTYFPPVHAMPNPYQNQPTFISPPQQGYFHDPYVSTAAVQNPNMSMQQLSNQFYTHTPSMTSPIVPLGYDPNADLSQLLPVDRLILTQDETSQPQSHPQSSAGRYNRSNINSKNQHP
ncbi:hypothetical protein ACQ4LE_005896 [Meloidogyne hapla]